MNDVETLAPPGRGYLQQGFFAAGKTTLRDDLSRDFALRIAFELRDLPTQTIAHVLEHLRRLSTGVQLGTDERTPLAPEIAAQLVQSLADYGGDEDVLDAFIKELTGALKTPLDVLGAKLFVEKIVQQHAVLAGMRMGNAEEEAALEGDEDDDEDSDAVVEGAMTPRPPKG